MSNQFHFVSLHVVVRIQLFQIVADDLFLVEHLAVGILRLNLQRGVFVREVIVLRTVEGVPIVVLGHPCRILASTAVIFVGC